MRANFGEHFKLTIFGESHGPAIGVVLDGLPAGAQIDETYIARWRGARRAMIRQPRRGRRPTRCACSPACLAGGRRARRSAR